jgi:uncharacterized protein
MGSSTRTVAWIKDEPFGVEYANVRLLRDRLTATGVAIAKGPMLYRLDYTLQTAAGFVTSRLDVQIRGEGWGRSLELKRDSGGSWTIGVLHTGEVDLPDPGGDPALLGDALDCDLGLSPLTNLLPLLRLDLLSSDAAAVEITTAWVSVPDLAVMADGQRYSLVNSDGDQHVVRYEATDGAFAAEITVDRDGLVLEYPGIGRRL